MQFFDRNDVPPPSSFRGGAVREERLGIAAFMQAAEDRLSQAEAPSRWFMPDKDEVLRDLERLFRGKCAFCETRTSPNIHLFRPSHEAEPLARSKFAHLYYVWLRTDWGNFYSACAPCTTTSRNQFPVRQSSRGPLPTAEELMRFANEDYGLWRSKHEDKRLLLDPCEDRNYVPHLSFDLSGGVRPLSIKGAATLEVFRLDREDLVQARADRFGEYVDLLRHELDHGISANSFGFETLEYGGAWYLLLRRLLQRIGSRLDRPVALGRDQIGSEVQEICATPLGRKALDSSLDEVRHPVEKHAVHRPTVAGSLRRLSAVQIRNFKGIGYLEIDIPPAVPEDASLERRSEAAALLVLGENAAGKSTILEAVALALADAGVRDRLRRPPESFVMNPSMMGSLDGRTPDRAEISILFEDGEQLELAIGRRFEETGAQDKLPPVFAYGAFRQYSPSAPKRPPLGNVITLFRSDVMLPNPEPWLLDLNEDDFAMIVRALKSILTIEGDFDVLRRDKANRRCLIVTDVGDGNDRRELVTPLSAASSGFRSVLAMVCDILRGFLRLQRTLGRKSISEIEAVLLVDEIEAHLHPRWKMQIMSALRNVFASSTIIGTTHDPLCLRGMHDGEVLVLNRELNEDPADASHSPVAVETLGHLPNVENLTIEQLLTSDFFSLFSTDSPTAELNVAKLADIVAGRKAGIRLKPAEAETLQTLEQQVVEALPLGSSEVQRLVLDAVSDYLVKRREASRTSLEALKGRTRSAILRALEGY